MPQRIIISLIAVNILQMSMNIYQERSYSKQILILMEENKSIRVDYHQKLDLIKIELHALKHVNK